MGDLEWEWVPSRAQCEKVSTCGKYGIHRGNLYHLGDHFRDRYLASWSTMGPDACPDWEGKKHQRELERLRNGDAW